jgi:hypothetical protein
VLPLPTAFMLHPVSPARRHFHLSQADAGGLTQYVVTACVAGFFASYACELWHLQAKQQGQVEIKQEQTSKSRQKDE